MEESVQATPTPLKGKKASAEHSAEGPEAEAQPCMATPTKEDTRPKVFIRGGWCKCRMASREMHSDSWSVSSFSSMSWPNS